jgi:hypothetical protein
LVGSTGSTNVSQSKRCGSAMLSSIRPANHACDAHTGAISVIVQRHCLTFASTFDTMAMGGCAYAFSSSSQRC